MERYKFIDGKWVSRKDVFFSAIFDVDVPCDGCILYEKCGAEKLACGLYYNTLQPKCKKKEKARFPLNRKPERRIYDAIFKAKD